MDGRNRMRGRAPLTAALPAALAVALAAGPAPAKTIEITAVGAPPPIVTPVKVTKEYIIPEINKRLAASGQDFKIQWKEAWGQSLAKFTEVLETVEAGIAEFGVQLVAFEESKLPLEQYSSVVPFGTTDELTMVDIDHAVRARVPEMDQTWLKYKQIRLTSASGEPFYLFTTFPMTSIDTLKGHKIGGSGSLAQYIRGVGPVIVTANMANSYTDIKNGVYDGYVISIGLSGAYRTYEAAKHVTKIGFSPAIVPELTMRTDTWKSLPEFVQKILPRRDGRISQGDQQGRHGAQRVLHRQDEEGRRHVQRFHGRAAGGVGEAHAQRRGRMGRTPRQAGSARLENSVRLHGRAARAAHHDLPRLGQGNAQVRETRPSDFRGRGRSSTGPFCVYGAAFGA